MTTKLSNLILNTLASHAGTMTHSNFAKNERSCLSRLAQKGLVAKHPATSPLGQLTGGACWQLTDDGIAAADAGGPQLGEIETAEGIAAIAATLAAERAAIARANAPDSKPSKRQAVASVTPAAKTAKPKRTKQAPTGAKRGTMANPVWGDTRPDVKTKVCGRDACAQGGKRQKAEKFQISYSSKDGLQYWCRECFNANAKLRAAAKKEAAEAVAS